MEGLKIKETLQEDQVYIVQADSEEVLTRFSTKDLSILFKWLKTYPKAPHYISVPMKEQYCEMIYILKPQSLIVIEPDTVYKALKGLLGHDTYEYMLEIAATSLDEGGNEISWDLPHFLNHFYSAKTRKEAIAIYNAWQEIIPLNEMSMCRVLEVIEYYRDEILNYFSLKEALCRKNTPIS